jgi:hypothetical protein
VADLLEHLADFAVAAFGKGDLVPGVFGVTDAADSGGLGEDATEFFFLGAAFVDHYAGAELVERLIAGLAADLDKIDLGHLVGGAGEQVGEVAVVGHQQQALALVVEAADGEDARLAGKELHHRRATLRVAGGGDVAFRLVEHRIAEAIGALARLGQQLAVDADVIESGVGFASELDDRLAVDLDASFSDQLLGLAAGGDSGRGDDLLQALFAADGREPRRFGWLYFKLVRERLRSGGKNGLGGISFGFYRGSLLRSTLLSCG